MVVLTPADLAAIEKVLTHARDGANRIQNGWECEPDHGARRIARNISDTCTKGLQHLAAVSQ